MTIDIEGLNDEEKLYVITQKIYALEIKQTPRRIREAALGVDNGWLADLNEQIATLRSLL